MVHLWTKDPKQAQGQARSFDLKTKGNAVLYCNFVLALFAPWRYKQKCCAAFKIVEKIVKKIGKKKFWAKYF